MAAANILAFIILTVFLSLYLKERVVDVLPAAACMLILVLYGLAFLHKLSAIDMISVLLIAVCIFWMLRIGKEKRREIGKAVKCELLHPGTLTAMISIGAITILVNDRIAVWWDDINFWAADVKALYVLDGFAGKYTNAVSEFGDYPPGLQLLKWWFVHMNPEKFSEGLMFAGYYFGIFVFLFPLLRKMKSKNPIVWISTAMILFAFPSVAEAFYCQGMCADLVMAVIFGAFLSAVMDREGHSGLFYWGRLILYLAVLVLIKSVGFLWAGFGIVFLWCYHLWVLKSDDKLKNRNKFPMLFAVVAASAVTGGSWMLFCLMMRRVAKLTGAAVSIASGNLPLFLPGVEEQLMLSFLEAFAVWPLHRGKTWAFDLSPLAMFLLICLMIFLFCRRNILRKREGRLLAIFVPVCGLIFYGINLVSHLTIFAAETQYLDPFAMVSSIERYGVPFTVGSMYLLAYLLLERKESIHLGRNWSVGTVCAMFVVLCANWPEVYDCVYGYRVELAEEKSARAEMITEESAEFLSMLEYTDKGTGIRILYLKDGAENQWVKNTYVAFEASPVSLIFGTVSEETASSGEILNMIEASHAGYFYMDKFDWDASEVFGGMTDQLEPGSLYRICDDGGVVRLEKADIVLPFE